MKRRFYDRRTQRYIRMAHTIRKRWLGEHTRWSNLGRFFNERGHWPGPWDGAVATYVVTGAGAATAMAHLQRRVA